MYLIVYTAASQCGFLDGLDVWSARQEGKKKQFSGEFWLSAAIVDGVDIILFHVLTIEDSIIFAEGWGDFV